MPATKTETYLSLNVNSRRGYTPDQVLNGGHSILTLGELADALQAAIDEHGADKPVLVNDPDEMGAAWGFIEQWRPAVTVWTADEEDGELSEVETY